MELLIGTIACVMTCLALWTIVRYKMQNSQSKLMVYASVQMEGIAIAYRLEKRLAEIYLEYADLIEFTSASGRMEMATEELIDEHHAVSNQAVGDARSKLLELDQKARELGIFDLAPSLLSQYGSQYPSLKLAIIP